MTDDTAANQKDAGPQGRWDLWLLGVGVIVLLVFWVLEPFFQGPLPPERGERGPKTGSPPRVAHANLFQARIVATPQYQKGGVTFDLPGEKARLEAWLQKNGHRDTLRRDPLMISTYHALGARQGGRISQHLQWFPYKVEADQLPYATPAGRFPKSKLDRHVVPLFTPAELARGPAVTRRPVVEYVPVNMHERGFNLLDLDLTGCRAGVGKDGKPALYYRIKPASREAHGDFSEEYIGFECALIIRGYVVSAPCFQSRITEQGMVPMRTKAETQALLEEIRTSLTDR